MPEIYFSKDYQEARAKFREAAQSRSEAVDSVTHPELGPDGLTLTTDIALVGAPEAENVLVMISATHGVEGFCGSGAQIHWLNQRQGPDLPPDVAVLLIHAINPYGFAWLRRVTNENVDLNRNWVNFDRPLPPNEGYEALRASIVPREWTDETQAASRATFMAFAQEQGPAALASALSAGQYTDPKGIWFGGSEPCWSRRTQTAIFEQYLSKARRVAVLDYHTGLGPWGYAEPISSFPRNSAEYERAREFFGANVVSMADGSSSSTAVAGDGLSAAPALLPHATVTSIALEFGTVAPEAAVEAVRADAWLHAHGDPLSPEARPIKRAIRDAFHGDREDWKGMVLGQSMQATRQAVTGLSTAA